MSSSYVKFQPGLHVVCTRLYMSYCVTIATDHSIVPLFGRVRLLYYNNRYNRFPSMFRHCLYCLRNSIPTKTLLPGKWVCLVLKSWYMIIAEAVSREHNGPIEIGCSENLGICHRKSLCTCFSLTTCCDDVLARLTQYRWLRCAIIFSVEMKSNWKLISTEN